MDRIMCPKCDNLLKKNTDTGQVKFQCECGFPGEDNDYSTPEDTLMASGSLVYEDEIGEEYNKFLRYAAYQSHNPKPDPELKVKCPSCKKGNTEKETNIRYVRITENEKIFYVCKCFNVFIL